MSELFDHPRLRMLFLPLLPPFDEEGDPVDAGMKMLWIPDSAVDVVLGHSRARHLRRTRPRPSAPPSEESVLRG